MRASERSLHVLLHRQVQKLALQQLVAVEPLARKPSVGDRGLNSARRLARVGAVALKRQPAASSSTSVNASWMPSSASQSCTSRRPGVSTSKAPPGKQISWRVTVVCGGHAILGDLVRRLPLLAGEPVGEGRLPDPGGTEQRDRPGGREVRLEFLEPGSGDVADRMNCSAERDLLDLEQRGDDVLAEVGLGQHEHRGGPALPRQGQIPLEPAHVQVAVESAAR